MNNYGNNFGFHNPQMTEKSINKINNECFFKFEDSSWHNDLVDSISNQETELKIMLPNSEVTNEDNEEFNTFSLINKDGDELFVTENVNSLIRYINLFI
tara:strand:+ start:1310 stop:1606 length:297 start_codon:yes stop_codon:yes gene_type:complete